MPSVCFSEVQSVTLKMKYHQFSKWLHKKTVVGWQCFTSGAPYFSSRLGLLKKFNISDCPCLFPVWWLIVVILLGVFMLRRLNLSISLPSVSLIPPLLCCDLMVCVCVGVFVFLSWLMPCRSVPVGCIHHYGCVFRARDAHQVKKREGGGGML